MLLPLALAFALLAGDPAPSGPVTPDCCAYPELPAHAASLEQLVPPGWSIETQARGAFDKESRPAVALVLHDAPVAATPARPAGVPRILAVALQNPDGSYDLTVQNHTLIPRLSEQDRYDYHLGAGKPEKDVEIPGLDFHRGALRVRLFAEFDTGSAAEDDRTYTFRLVGGRLLLIGYDSSFVLYSLESGAWSIDFLTRKISLTSGESCAGRSDVIRHCRWRTSWKDLKAGPLLTIDEVGNGLSDFEPENLWPED